MQSAYKMAGGPAAPNGRPDVVPPEGVVPGSCSGDPIVEGDGRVTLDILNAVFVPR